MFKSVIAAEKWAEHNGWERRKNGIWFRPSQRIWFNDKWSWSSPFPFKIMKHEVSGKEPFWFFA